MSKVITAYFLRVDEDTEIPYQGYLGELKDTLEIIDRYVNFGRDGGIMQTVSLNADLIAVCHDEGKLFGFPANRGIFYDGKLCDWIAGNVFVVRHKDGEFVSVLPSDIPYIEEHLRPVMSLGGGVIIGLPVNELPEYKEKK